MFPAINSQKWLQTSLNLQHILVHNSSDLKSSLLLIPAQPAPPGAHNSNTFSAQLGFESVEASEILINLCLKRASWIWLFFSVWTEVVEEETVIDVATVVELHACLEFLLSGEVARVDGFCDLGGDVVEVVGVGLVVFGVVEFHDVGVDEWREFMVLVF